MNNMNTLIANLHSAICNPKKGLEFLTKRELFAAMAMKGLISHSSSTRMDSDQLVGLSIEYADALLKALEGE